MVLERNGAAAHESLQVGLHMGSTSQWDWQGVEAKRLSRGIANPTVSCGREGEFENIATKARKRFAALRTFAENGLLRFGRTSIGRRGV
jgi:hypothetical protein